MGVIVKPFDVFRAVCLDPGFNPTGLPEGWDGWQRLCKSLQLPPDKTENLKEWFSLLTEVMDNMSQGVPVSEAVCAAVYHLWEALQPEQELSPCSLPLTQILGSNAELETTTVQPRAYITQKARDKRGKRKEYWYYVAFEGYDEDEEGDWYSAGQLRKGYPGGDKLIAEFEAEWQRQHHAHLEAARTSAGGQLETGHWCHGGNTGPKTPGEGAAREEPAQPWQKRTDDAGPSRAPVSAGTYASLSGLAPPPQQTPLPASHAHINRSPRAYLPAKLSTSHTVPDVHQAPAGPEPGPSALPRPVPGAQQANTFQDKAAPWPWERPLGSGDQAPPSAYKARSLAAMLDTAPAPVKSLGDGPPAAAAPAGPSVPDPSALQSTPVGAAPRPSLGPVLQRHHPAWPAAQAAGPAPEAAPALTPPAGSGAGSNRLALRGPALVAPRRHRWPLGATSQPPLAIRSETRPGAEHATSEPSAQPAGAADVRCLAEIAHCEAQPFPPGVVHDGGAGPGQPQHVWHAQPTPAADVHALDSHEQKTHNWVAEPVKLAGLGSGPPPLAKGVAAALLSTLRMSAVHLLVKSRDTASAGSDDGGVGCSRQAGPGGSPSAAAEALGAGEPGWRLGSSPGVGGPQGGVMECGQGAAGSRAGARGTRRRAGARWKAAAANAWGGDTTAGRPEDGAAAVGKGGMQLRQRQGRGAAVAHGRKRRQETQGEETVEGLIEEDEDEEEWSEESDSADETEWEEADVTMEGREGEGDETDGDRDEEEEEKEEEEKEGMGVAADDDGLAGGAVATHQIQQAGQGAIVDWEEQGEEGGSDGGDEEEEEAVGESDSSSDDWHEEEELQMARLQRGPRGPGRPPAVGFKWFARRRVRGIARGVRGGGRGGVRRGARGGGRRGGRGEGRGGRRDGGRGSRRSSHEQAERAQRMDGGTLDPQTAASQVLEVPAPAPLIPAIAPQLQAGGQQQAQPALPQQRPPEEDAFHVAKALVQQQAVLGADLQQQAVSGGLQHRQAGQYRLRLLAKRDRGALHGGSTMSSPTGDSEGDPAPNTPPAKRSTGQRAPPPRTPSPLALPRQRLLDNAADACDGAVEASSPDRRTATPGGGDVVGVNKGSDNLDGLAPGLVHLPSKGSAAEVQLSAMVAALRRPVVAPGGDPYIYVPDSPTAAPGAIASTSRSPLRAFPEGWSPWHGAPDCSIPGSLNSPPGAENPPGTSACPRTAIPMPDETTDGNGTFHRHGHVQSFAQPASTPQGLEVAGSGVVAGMDAASPAQTAIAVALVLTGTVGDSTPSIDGRGQLGTAVGAASTSQSFPLCSSPAGHMLLPLASSQGGERGSIQAVSMSPPRSRSWQHASLGVHIGGGQTTGCTVLDASSGSLDSRGRFKRTALSLLQSKLGRLTPLRQPAGIGEGVGAAPGSEAAVGGKDDAAEKTCKD